MNASLDILRVGIYSIWGEWSLRMAIYTMVELLVESLMATEFTTQHRKIRQ